MMWGKQLRSWWLFVFFVVFFASLTLQGIQAQSDSSTPTSPSPAPATSQQELTSSDALQSLEAAWTALKLELSESESDWQRVLQLLSALQIETKEYKASLQQSTEQLENLKLSYNEERDALIARNVQLTRENTVLADTLVGWKIAGVTFLCAGAIGYALYFTK